MIKTLQNRIGNTAFYRHATFYTLFVFIFLFPLIGQNKFTPVILDNKATDILVDSLASQIKKYYVFKEQAIKINDYLKKRCKAGLYYGINDPHILAGVLTKEVSSIFQDEHFHVEYNPELANELSGDIEDVPKMVEEKLRIDRERNFGFKKVEILNGNIGYIEISSFSRLNKYSKAIADAALKMVSNSSAIIIDLRYGVGGSPEMVNYIISHFFKSKTHVIDIYIRSENLNLPYWTTPDSSNTALTKVPIYILTSYKTFSAAEGLSYELQSLKRATIVGEVTRGGAHTVTYRNLSSGFVADIPFGRATSPITKTNWERTGVIPDIRVSEDLTLETAELKIFENANQNAKDSAQIKALKWQFDLLQSINHPVKMDSAELINLVGFYGPYSVLFNNGNLYYQKLGKAKFQLLPLTKSIMKVRGNDTFRIEFLPNEEGKINRIATFYDDGRVEYAQRIK